MLKMRYSSKVLILESTVSCHHHQEARAVNLYLFVAAGGAPLGATIMRSKVKVQVHLYLFHVGNRNINSDWCSSQGVHYAWYIT